VTNPTTFAFDFDCPCLRLLVPVRPPKVQGAGLQRDFRFFSTESAPVGRCATRGREYHGTSTGISLRWPHHRESTRRAASANVLAVRAGLEVVADSEGIARV
jgi:hypothetical protein